MAAALLQSAASKAGSDLQVQSAGIAAFPGVPYSPEAVEALKERGIDLSGGTSQPLSKTLVMESDLLLTMTAQHRDAILRKLPALEGKVFQVVDYAGDTPGDIEDPVGQPLEAYRQVRDRLEAVMDAVIARLKT